jgi:hypothetical protein
MDNTILVSKIDQVLDDIKKEMAENEFISPSELDRLNYLFGYQDALNYVRDIINKG